MILWDFRCSYSSKKKLVTGLKRKASFKLYVYMYIYIYMYIVLYISYTCIKSLPHIPSSPWCPQVLVNLVYQVEQIGTACNKVTLGAEELSWMVKESDWLYYMLLPISTITLLHHYNINMFTTLLLSQHGVGMVGAWVSTVSMFEPKKRQLRSDFSQTDLNSLKLLSFVSEFWIW